MKRGIKSAVLAALLCVALAACSPVADGAAGSGQADPSAPVADAPEAQAAPEQGTRLLEHGEKDITAFESRAYDGPVIERDWILTKVERDFSYLRNEKNRVESSVELEADGQGGEAEVTHTVITNPDTGRQVRKTEQLRPEGYLLSRYYYEDELFLEDLAVSWDLVWMADDFLLGSSGIGSFYYDVQGGQMEYICYPFTEQIPKNADNAIDLSRFSGMEVNATGLVAMDFDGRQLVYCVGEADGFASDSLLYYNWASGESFLFQENLVEPELGGKTSVFTHFAGDSLYYSLRGNESNNAVSICRLDIPTRQVETLITSGDETTFLGGARFVAFNRFDTVRDEALYQPTELAHPVEFLVHDLEQGQTVYREQGTYMAMLYNRYVLYIRDGDLHAYDLAAEQLYRISMDRLAELFPDRDIQYNIVLLVDGEEYMPDYSEMFS